MDESLGRHNVHGAAVVTVSGELDATTASDLQNWLNHVDTGQCAVVLDLAGVTFCDSIPRPAQPCLAIRYNRIAE